MRIAIASGKGGTGKTSISVLLAKYLSFETGQEVDFLDCDCEAPNGHIFFQVHLTPLKTVNIFTPKVDTSKCTFCGKCSEICRFNAITVLGNKVAMTFPELCHGCYGCFRVCESSAIKEDPRRIGKVYAGRHEDGATRIHLVQGVLRIGEAMSPPLIKAVLEEGEASSNLVAVTDCPPGTSCPVVTSIKGADLVVIVAESSPFGLHDAAILTKVVRRLGLPFAIVANKVLDENTLIHEWCAKEGYRYLGGIPFSPDFSMEYARGGDIFKAAKRMPEIEEVLCRITEMVQER